MMLKLFIIFVFANDIIETKPSVNFETTRDTSKYCPSNLKVYQDIAIVWENTFNPDLSYDVSSEQMVDLITNKLFNDPAYQFYDDFGNYVTQMVAIPFPNSTDYNIYGFNDNYRDINSTIRDQLIQSENMGDRIYSDISGGLDSLIDIESSRRQGVQQSIIIFAKSDEDALQASSDAYSLQQWYGATIYVISVGYRETSNLCSLATFQYNCFYISDPSDWSHVMYVRDQLKSLLANYCPDNGYTQTNWPPYEYTTPWYPQTAPWYPTNPWYTIQPTGDFSNCFGIIFVGEMSRSISTQQKKDFYTVVLQIVGTLSSPNYLQFAITTYGYDINQQIYFQNYDDFVTTVAQMEAQLPNPNSGQTYIEPPLNAVYDTIQSYWNQKITVFFMGEMEAIMDPSRGYSASNRIAATGTNVYVLDYSKGLIQTSLWPYLTNNLPDRIIFGTGESALDIYKIFSQTMVQNINNGQC